MDVKKYTLSLLQRPEVTTPLLVPGAYRPSPLTSDLDRLADPRTPFTRQDLVALLCKYLHSFVHPGSHNQSIHLNEITRLFDQFANRRRGAVSLEDKPDLRRKLLDYGFALCMLADLPKTSHILWDILHRNPMISVESPSETFVGLDIGSGTGVLMLGMWLLAKRSGFTSCDIIGLERNKLVAAHTNGLISELGIGRILATDAKQPKAFNNLNLKTIHFVANETLPSQGHRLWKEDFPVINEMLFLQCSDALSGTHFFPSAVYAIDSRGGKEFRLSPKNRFQPDSDYPLRLMLMAGIELSGRPILLEHVGSGWRDLINDAWLPLLAHRW